ncbi:MAG: DUF4349 domain-containing protein [Chitinophagaceae bacterium]
MKSMYSIAGLFLLGIALSCNTRNEASNDEATKNIAAVNLVQEEQSPLADSAGQPGAAGKKNSTPQPAAVPDWDKKIIKTASLDAEVKDFQSFYTSMREKVKALGGYIAQEEQRQSAYKIENAVMIKVPVDQFDNAVAQLTAGMQTINEKKIASQDVTTEVVDTRSRMEAKKQVRQRYMDLLSQAKNMQEILDVQSEINAVQVEIESAAGRMEYLNHSAVFSTIHLTYYQVLNFSARDEAKPSFATRLGSAFGTGWSWLVDLFVGLASVWPLLLLSLVVIVLYRKTKQRSKGRTSA